MSLLGILISLTVGVSSAAPTSPKPYVLVSDLDDTIKVSHVMDFENKIVRFLADPVSFSGMATLYRGMIDEAKLRGQKTHFTVLSGTPTLFEYSIWNFMELFDFPEPGNVVTRTLLQNMEEYKTEAVSEIISRRSMKGATVILVGDDTEKDFAAYRAATQSRRAQKGLQTQIYIRRVGSSANRLTGTTPGAFSFDSAADVAIIEFAAGRIGRLTVEEVFRELTAEFDIERLFVPQEYCPTGAATRLSSVLKPSVAMPADLIAELVTVEDHLRERCKESFLRFRNAE